MGAIRRFECIGKGITHFFRTGHYLTHLFKDESDFLPCIIITDGNKFRLSDTFVHKIGEEVYPNAGYRICRCVRCGKKEIEWVRMLNARLPIVTAEGEVKYEMDKKRKTQ